MLTLNDGRTELWQWDTGRKLTVDDDCSQVHFSNKVFGRSIDADVADGVAIIPDILLQTDKDLTAWAFVGTAENGYTKISKVFKVNKRNKPADYVFTPQDQSTLGEILDRIEDLENRPSGDISAEDIQNAVKDYLDKNPVSFEEKDPTVPSWAKQPNPPKQPTTLPNPNKLTFTGAVTAEYDGSEAVEVKIPEGSSGGGIEVTGAEVGQTIVVKAVDENGKPTEWETADFPSGGSAQKKWDLLGEYTFTEDAPVSTITLTDLLGYTAFVVYFQGLYTTVATADISFYVNDKRVWGASNADNAFKKVHLTLADAWHVLATNVRQSTTATAPVEANNYMTSNESPNTTEPAVKLQIKNRYGSSSFKKGTVVIYGGK